MLYRVSSIGFLIMVFLGLGVWFWEVIFCWVRGLFFFFRGRELFAAFVFFWFVFVCVFFCLE